ncbi:glycosyltransferase family 4 protein [Levilactobacillus tujiorum]|uniref:Glycosyltransferase family 4 protein n=1 Tax=Levilactobacillus tujiorum TaxID=2912243 RepID=A0ABX1L363_9LACO|nr:glycosyltransferase family 4 protein [Levilactobacillus tujiorum]MCH5463841.1 glycosyltransferase family 4 protein [Levilactobacillus tujiorum]NLR11048.1 glycosyltransferase family 4 protein [Lactobacillus sp. HBUAS51387]NLR28754.1 glycosyltransferase family 4 protein [Levilactobacillus tujiorum]
MKIFLAGPLPTSMGSGGVAVFTLNLAKKLVALGYDVRVFTDRKSLKACNDQGLEVDDIHRVRHFVRTMQPDVIISSLWYSLFFMGFKHVYKIHLVHGFTNLRSYTNVKFALMIMVDRVLRRSFQEFLANSEFTRLVNEEIYGQKIDGVFRIGLLDSEIASLVDNASQSAKKDEVLYVGRLVKAKNVDRIIEAYGAAIKSVSCQLHIVGYGPERGALQASTQECADVIFEGAKDHRVVADDYRRARVFISLNPTEPFGITYLEALLANDFIIAPNVGGQVELLRQFPERVSLVNVTNKQEVTRAIEKGLQASFKCFSDQYDPKVFSYDRTVKEILKNEK